MNKIVNADCIPFLRGLSNDFVDVSFADPPFNLGKKYTSYNDTRNEQDYFAWCEQWLTQLVRVTRGAVFIHGTFSLLCQYFKVLEKLASFKHWIAWNAPTGIAGTKGLQPTHYGILYFEKSPTFNKIRYPHLRDKGGRMVKNYGGKASLIHPFGPVVSDVWTDIHRVQHNRDAHPCQLPPALLERLILMASNEGDVIFDPFMGTGTTAVAAKKLNRRYLGCEIDAAYANIAKANVEAAKQTTIANIPVSLHRGNLRTIRDADWPILSQFHYIPENIKTEAVALF